MRVSSTIKNAEKPLFSGYIGIYEVSLEQEKINDNIKRKYSQLYNVPPVSVPQRYLDILSTHTWPGNVRELQNIIESSLIMMDPQKDEVSLPNISILTKRDSLPMPDPIPFSAKNTEQAPNSCNLKAALSSLETDMILKALRDYNGNITRAAKSLGISRSNLQYRMKKLQISMNSVN